MTDQPGAVMACSAAIVALISLNSSSKYSSLCPLECSLRKILMASSSLSVDIKCLGDSGMNMIPSANRALGTHWNARGTRHWTALLSDVTPQP